jgi:hypothetical protein
MAIIEEGLPVASRFVRGHLYVRPPKPVIFPAFDEEPVGETRRHLDIRTALYLVMKNAFAASATLGSDQFVYWDRSDPRRCVCPDVFVKLGVPDAHFDVWSTWERGTLDIAVEIRGDNDREPRAWEEKLDRYRAAGIRELVSFDDQDEERPIRIWDHVDGDLVERAPDDASLLSCQALGLWWTTVHDGAVRTLRLARDREGRDLLPTPTEAAVRKVREELAAERKLREERDAEIERLKAELSRIKGAK